MRSLKTLAALALVATAAHAAASTGPYYQASPDAEQARYSKRVQEILQRQEAAMHAMGASGSSVDDAEKQWGAFANKHLKEEMAELGSAVRAGELSKKRAVELVLDEYHAVKEASEHVEKVLKQHHKVPLDHQNQVDKAIPPPPPGLGSAHPAKPQQLTSTNQQLLLPPSQEEDEQEGEQDDEHEEEDEQDEQEGPSLVPASFLAGLQQQPAMATNPDQAEARFDEQVRRTKLLQQHVMREAGLHGLGVSGAEAAWEKVARKHLVDEKHALERAEKVLPDSVLDARKEREVLGDSYRAIVEAARQVEAELEAAGKVPAGHTTPMLPHGLAATTPTATSTATPAATAASAATAAATPTTASTATPTATKTTTTTTATSTPAQLEGEEEEEEEEAPQPQSPSFPLPPPIPSDPVLARQQWEAEVARIAADEKRTLQRLGSERKADGTRRTVDEAEAGWAQIVAERLRREAKMLRAEVLEHRLGADEAEARLREDYEAAREAAGRVDQELLAHGVTPHHPVTPHHSGHVDQGRGAAAHPHPAVVEERDEDEEEDDEEEDEAEEEGAVRAEALAQTQTQEQETQEQAETPSLRGAAKKKEVVEIATPTPPAASATPATSTTAAPATATTTTTATAAATTAAPATSSAVPTTATATTSATASTTTENADADTASVKIAASTSSTADNASPVSSSSGGGWSRAVIVGGGVGFVALVALAVLGAVSYARRRGERQRQQQEGGQAQRGRARGGTVIRVVQGSTAPASPSETRVTTTNFVQML